jgi:hypothetical protein
LDANKLQRFEKLDFEGFRELARDASLTRYEKIGFPDSYREGYEEAIFSDIQGKLTNLHKPGQTILDIGPGCTDLPNMLVDLCRKQGHQLILVDSQEMLDQLPDAPFITKLAGYYPDDTKQLIADYAARVNVVLVYSVIQYVFVEGNINNFVDQSLSLLAPGGQLLIGDIPNISKRKRFFSSQAGIDLHKAYTQSDETPQVEHAVLEPGKLDDGVLFGLLLRSRMAGFDSYLLPQGETLPMYNRREDLLITRP